MKFLVNLKDQKIYFVDSKDQKIPSGFEELYKFASDFKKALFSWPPVVANRNLFGGLSTYIEI